jgi:hypothetical protein
VEALKASWAQAVEVTQHHSHAVYWPNWKSHAAQVREMGKETPIPALKTFHTA